MDRYEVKDADGNYLGYVVPAQSGNEWMSFFRIMNPQRADIRRHQTMLLAIAHIRRLPG